MTSVKVGAGALLAVLCVVSVLAAACRRPADPVPVVDCKVGWEERKAAAYRVEQSRRKHLSETQYKPLIERENKRQDDWTRAFDRRQIDLHALPRADFPAIVDYFGPQHHTLQAVVDAADLIVVASVRTVRFDVDNRSFVRRRSTATYSIERLLKGTFPHVLTTPAYFYVEPKETCGEVDWNNPSNAVLVADNDSPTPVLLPGDRVVLFLKQVAGEPYEPFSWVGTYHLREGRVTTLARNPLRGVAEGQGEEAFIDTVRRLVRR